METQPRSAMAVASLVLGIVALVTSILPVINNLSFLLAILGIVFAIVGLVGISKGKKSGKGLGVAGLVLSVIAFILVLVMQSAFSAALDQAMEESGLDTATAQGVAAGDSGSAAEQSEATQAAYGVTIDDCRVTEDYQGNPAAVVTYTFTNNSDEATSPAVAVHAKAFQNGTELELAVVADAEESGKSMNEVKPGSSITYESAYELADMSDLTVEVEELFSFSDELIAEQTFSLS